MKNARLADLALASQGDDLLLVEALAERLRGERGAAYAALLVRQSQRPTPARTAPGEAWWSGLQKAPIWAQRRDGLSVQQGDHPELPPRAAGEPVPWYALFPALQGGRQPVAELTRSDTLADACEEADQRWPMPDWWLRLDVSGVVDACGAASSNGIRCGRPSGHPGDHWWRT